MDLSFTLFVTASYVLELSYGDEEAEQSEISQIGTLTCKKSQRIKLKRVREETERQREDMRGIGKRDQRNRFLKTRDSLQ